MGYDYWRDDTDADEDEDWRSGLDGGMIVDMDQDSDYNDTSSDDDD